MGRDGEVCVLCAVYCVPCAVCCVLCAVCCVLCAVCCVLWAVCCVLCAVCCVLCAVCCVSWRARRTPCTTCTERRAHISVEGTLWLCTGSHWCILKERGATVPRARASGLYKIQELGLVEYHLARYTLVLTGVRPTL